MFMWLSWGESRFMRPYTVSRRTLWCQPMPWGFTTRKLHSPSAVLLQDCSSSGVLVTMMSSEWSLFSLKWVTYSGFSLEERQEETYCGPLCKSEILLVWWSVVQNGSWQKVYDWQGYHTYGFVWLVMWPTLGRVGCEIWVCSISNVAHYCGEWVVRYEYDPLVMWPTRR